MTTPATEPVETKVEEAEETHSFQAETAKILQLMIHSVYSNREVFLRELISNASDAIDKVRFMALTDDALRADGDHDYAITIRPDAESDTLVIEDNGVGMSYDEVVKNIGTIARSGTAEFASRLQEAQQSGDVALIGRFGVGFYSAFIVADHVTLETWKFGEPNGVRWSSVGDGSYKISRIPPRRRGTTVTLRLRKADGNDENYKNFSSEYEIRETVRRHSDYVAFPIVLETWVDAKTGDDDDFDGDDDGDGDGGSNSDGVEAEASADSAKAAAVDDAPTLKRDTINRQKPLWTRDSKEITDEEHEEFYRHLTHDWGKPSDRLHVKAEGTVEFTALLYVPAKAPFDLYSREGKRGLSLYVRNVFVMDQCRDLLPEYLRFVRGLVDSADLPLNVSREMVQQDRRIAQFRKVLVKRLLDRFAVVARDDRERWTTIWEEVGPVIKEAFHYEPAVQEKVEPCLLFRTTHGDDWSSLADINGRMAEGQDAIYYLAGDDLATLKSSPHLEIFREKGAEVLLLTDPIDNVALVALEKLGGKTMRDAADPQLNPSDIGVKVQDEPDKPADADLGALAAKLTELLSESVAEVRASRRLRDSAACLVAGGDGPNAAVERMMKAMGQAMPERKRVLELNPTHPLIERLRALAEGTPDDPRIAEFGELLVDQALVAAGERPRDVAAFARRLSEVAAAALNA